MCCVPGCYYNMKKDKELSLHKFPKEEAVRKRWINALERKDFVPSEQHCVCSTCFVDRKRKDVPHVFTVLPQPECRKPSVLCGSLPPTNTTERKKSY